MTIPGQTPRSKQRFDRIYICFEAQRAAWKSTCRPIIGLDGAFLKWDVKGQLIAAVGRDGNNRIVSIGLVVVEIENDINWAWFVNHLKVDLQLGDGSNFTSISDKQKVKILAYFVCFGKLVSYMSFCLKGFGEKLFTSNFPMQNIVCVRDTF